MESSYSAVFPNLAKACEKQLRTTEAGLLWEVSRYFEKNNSESEPIVDLKGLSDALALDDKEHLPDLQATAQEAADRGALRMGVWGAKVNTIEKTVTDRYLKVGDALLEGKSIFVCEACGFIFIGQEAPEICPVCKAPQSRFSKIA